MKVPPRIEELFKDLRIFERNKEALEVKAFAIATRIHGEFYL
jgi:hypothetical protein